MTYDYDVIVVGGGHAGMEAAFAASHMGCKTLLISLNIKMMANMPCNPSIGGSAKGIVVREIDALGGMMGIVADKTYLQMKMLNTSKGPGVQCLRAQADKLDYPKTMQNIALSTDNLTILEGMVISLLNDENKVFGVKLIDREITSQAVILTTGTYMESTILVGHNVKKAGPDGEKSSLGLSPYLAKMGIKLIRLKTGTPQRIKKDSIDFSVLTPHYGSLGEYAFSYTTKKFKPIEEQIPCYMTYTNQKTHEIINKHLKDSALFGGFVTGVGPRYCPSIEDKVTRFKDKERHQLFLEPESIHTDSIYLQGFSTSMPEDVQLEMVHSLKGLEHAEILKYAYAIEYDAIQTEEFDNTLMIKKWPGLFIGGQICGTSGYEEAAGLGLIAGINAVLWTRHKPPFILRRDEAYIGVMIDDLITKGTKEPYRLLSSRAEYRLLLRHDNADRRLTKYGYELGLISQKRYDEFAQKEENLKDLKSKIENYYFSDNKELSSYALKVSGSEVKPSSNAASVLKRPGIKLEELKKYLPFDFSNLSSQALFQLETEIKYEGYISKELKEAERLRKLEEIVLPNFDYLSLSGLALEARQKLDKVKPRTLGQASRISGVNPADIAYLLVNLRKEGIK